MRFRTHHGKNKITDFSEVGNLSIVLTTYQTVSADCKEGNQRSKSVLYSRRWNRVILDEGTILQMGLSVSPSIQDSVDSNSTFHQERAQQNVSGCMSP